MRNQIRPELHGEGFYLVQDDFHLQLVPEKLFEYLAAQVQAALIRPADKAKANRFFFAGIEKLDPDKQGRIMIPDGFMKDSKNPDPLVRTRISREVTVVGSGDRIEIWDREEFQDFMRQANKESKSFEPQTMELFGAMKPVPQLAGAGSTAASKMEEAGSEA